MSENGDKDPLGVLLKISELIDDFRRGSESTENVSSIVDNFELKESVPPIRFQTGDPLREMMGYELLRLSDLLIKVVNETPESELRETVLRFARVLIVTRDHKKIQFTIDTKQSLI